ncbi:MAG TPA: hypothetical protein VFS21_21610 [Roseiflexaceae bacterium]|nr:hypothetical protein [Roseiflexaceae bacterium]
MPIFTDVNRLGSRISLPAGVTAATWTVVALGSGGSGIGPTDTRLCGLLTLDDAGWQAVGSSSSQAEVELTADVADAILPAELRSMFTQDGNTLRISAPAYNATVFESSLYHPGYAVRLGDQLLVCLQTR